MYTQLSTEIALLASYLQMIASLSLAIYRRKRYYVQQSTEDSIFMSTEDSVGSKIDWDDRERTVCKRQI